MLKQDINISVKEFFILIKDTQLSNTVFDCLILDFFINICDSTVCNCNLIVLWSCLF